MIPDAPLPPWLRRCQQSWYWQALGLPLFIGFGGSLVAQGCLTAGLQHIESACMYSALSATVISFLTVLISGHSPGSASFDASGKPVEAPKP